jgi:hypothetical protein
MTSNQKLIAAALGVGVVVVIVVKLSGNDPPKPAMPDAGPALTAEAPPPIVSAKPTPVASNAPSPSAEPNTPGPTSVDLGTLAYEAKMVTRAQAALDKKDYKLALREIEDYEKIPNREFLSAEATRIKIDALVHLPGRKTDGLALAQETRSDEKYKDKREAIEAILYDAGLAQPTSASP